MARVLLVEDEPNIVSIVPAAAEALQPDPVPATAGNP